MLSYACVIIKSTPNVKTNTDQKDFKGGFRLRVGNMEYKLVKDKRKSDS